MLLAAGRTTRAAGVSGEAPTYGNSLCANSAGLNAALLPSPKSCTTVRIIMVMWLLSGLVNCSRYADHIMKGFTDVTSKSRSV
jgi:hypothetical protein